MDEATAVKLIYNHLMSGGLPRAIEIYNYLGCYGEIPVTKEMIDIYFG